jgi:hypothetical protein
MWGVRCALDTGVALALGLTTAELETRLRTRTLAQIAAERDVPMPRLRQIAWSIAEPQLEAAVAAGAIDESERLALHRRIDEKRGPWSDVTSSRATRIRRHAGRSALLSLSSSSSSSRPAHVLGGSEAGKLSASSSSSLSSSSPRGGVRSSVTRTSHRPS